MFADRPWEETLALYECYKAVGTSSVHLNLPIKELPWQYVTNVPDDTNSGTYRWSMKTSYTFEAYFSEEDFTLKWFFNLEERESSGAGTFNILIDDITYAMSSLSTVGREQFKSRLKNAYEGLMERGEEYSNVAHTQFSQADEIAILIG